VVRIDHTDHLRDLEAPDEVKKARQYIICDLIFVKAKLKLKKKSPQLLCAANAV